MGHLVAASLACLLVLQVAAGQQSSSHGQHGGGQQQQHHSPNYIIPSPVTRQGGLGGALGGLGGLGGGFASQFSTGPFDHLWTQGPGPGFDGPGGSGGGLSSLLSGLGGLGGSSMLSTALPLMMVLGLGAMLVPLLGGAFFRESQKRGLPSISPAFMDGVTDIIEKVVKALDSVDTTPKGNKKH